MKFPGKWQKVVEQNNDYVVMLLHCSIKFLMKMKNVSFIFTEKPKELFGQPNAM